MTTVCQHEHSKYIKYEPSFNISHKTCEVKDCESHTQCVYTEAKTLRKCVVCGQEFRVPSIARGK